jgi:hypothetical protein
MGVPDFCARWRALNTLQVAVGAKVSVASMSHRIVRCTPDSPVNYSGAPLDFPEGDKFELESSGAPDTVRCARPEVPSVVPFALLLNPILGLFIG